MSLTPPHTHYTQSSWTLPPSLSALSIDLPGTRYAVTKAQNGNFDDGSRAVWPAMQAKVSHFIHSGQSYGGSKSNVSKKVTKVPYFNADLEVGSRFGPLHRQKRLKSPPKKLTLAILAKKWHSAEVFSQVGSQWGFF